MPGKFLGDRDIPGFHQDIRYKIMAEGMRGNGTDIGITQAVTDNAVDNIPTGVS